MLISLSPGSNSPNAPLARDMHRLAAKMQQPIMARLTGDFWDNWSELSGHFAYAAQLERFSSPLFSPDLDVRLTCMYFLDLVALAASLTRRAIAFQNITLRSDVVYTQPIEPDAFQGEPVTCDLRWTGSRMPLVLAGGGAQLVTYTLAPQGTPKLAAEARRTREPSSTP